jgi:CCR4-NOT transcription complex subunit 6
MYYPQQSPAITHKLATHHDQNPWSRQHHPVLAPPGSQPAVVPNVGPPPTSPGYAIYTNGQVNPIQHHPSHISHPISHSSIQHHHSNSLGHYPSAPNGHSNHQPIVISQGSPASVPGQVTSSNWQQQLLKCEVRL